MRTFVRLAAGILAGRMGATLAQGVTLVILARALSPTSFARLAAVLGVAAFVSAVADLGTSTRGTRASALRAHGELADLQRLNQAAALVAGAAMALVLLAMAHFAPIPGGWWLGGLGVWMWIDRMAEFQLGRLVGEGRAAAVATNVTLRRIVPLVLVACASALGVRWVVPAFVIGSVIGSAALLGAADWRSVRGEAATPTLQFRATLTKTAAFWVNSMSAQLRQLDVVMVSAIGGVAVAAAYAPVSRLISPLRMLPTSLAQAALATRAGDTRKSSGRQQLMIAMVPSALLFLGMAVVAEPIIRVLFGPAYAASVEPLRIVLIGLVFAAGASMQTSLLQAAGRETVAAQVNSACAVLAIVLIGAGTYLDDSAGAAWGLLVGYLVQCASLVLGSVASQRSVESIVE